MAIIKDKAILYVTVSGIDNKQKETYPDAAKLTADFIQQKPLAAEPLQKTLQALVMAGENLQAIQVLIDAGADVNYTYTGANKLLFMAYKNGNPEVVNLLLQNGASLTPNEREFFKEMEPAFASSSAFLKAAETDTEPSISSKPVI
jgi:ankyrin repeat protein